MSCGPAVVDGPWMQIHFGFDPHAAEIKSHCSAHHAADTSVPYEYPEKSLLWATHSTRG